MVEREMKNAPSLNGWIFAVAAGLVALVASLVVGEFDFTSAAFIAAGITLLVGLILGMPLGGSGSGPVARHSVAVAPKAVSPAPVMAVAPVMSSPVMAAAPATADASVADAAAAPAAFVAEPAAAAPLGDGPMRLSAPRGVADDLKEIEGIGPALEKLCNELGFHHFDQIAAWTDADVAWVDANMPRFKGRIERDRWVAQARLIVAEGVDAFRVRAKTNDY